MCTVCMPFSLLLHTNIYKELVVGRYVLHTYILSLYNVLSLSFFRNPLISPGVEKQKEKTLMLGWHLVKRPPADEADDLFFVWNREIQDLVEMMPLLFAPFGKYRHRVLSADHFNYWHKIFLQFNPALACNITFTLIGRFSMIW